MPAGIKIGVDIVPQNVDRVASDLANKLQTAINNGIGRGLGGIGGTAGNAFGQLNNGVKDFETSLGRANQRVLAFGTSAGLLYGSIRAFKELLGATIDVEKSLSKIQSVMALTQQQITQVSRGLFDVARQTGESFDDAADAFETFSKQGGTVEQTLQRTRIALALARTTNIDTTESVKGLIAAYSNFNRVGEDYQSVANKISTANRSFAIGGRDLIEGINQIGAQALDSGVSLNKLIGLITATGVIANRQGPAIAQSLQRIFARLEENANIGKLSKIIDIRDDNGQIKSGIDLLNSLAEAYNKVSREKQQTISQTAAGIFSPNVFHALITDLNSVNGIVAQVSGTLDKNVGNIYARLAQQNDNLATSLKNLQTSATQVGSTIGELAVKPALNTLIGGASAVGTGFGLFSGVKASGDTKASEDFGAYLGENILKGIGNVVGGPGLVLVTRLLFGVLSRSAGLFIQDFKQTLGFASVAQQETTFQRGINNLLAQATTEEQARFRAASNTTEQANILNGILTRQVQLYAQIRAEQTALYEGLGALPGVRGQIIKAGGAAGGYMPGGVVGENMAINQGVGGAPLSARSVLIPSFAYGGGVTGPIVANTSEFVVHGGGGSAIYNRNMIKQYGLPPGAEPVAAGGYVPSMAEGGTVSDTVAGTLRRVSPLFTPLVAGQDPVQQFQQGLSQLIKKGFDLSQLNLNAPTQQLRASVRDLIASSLQISEASLNDPKVRAALSKTTSAVLEAQSGHVAYYSSLQAAEAARAAGNPSAYPSPIGPQFNPYGTANASAYPSPIGPQPLRFGQPVLGGGVIIPTLPGQEAGDVLPQSNFGTAAEYDAYLARRRAAVNRIPQKPLSPNEESLENALLSNPARDRYAQFSNRLNTGLLLGSFAAPALGLGGAGSSILTGGAIGGQVGASIGPEGIIPGAIIGGLIGAIKSFSDKTSESFSALAKSIEDNNAKAAQKLNNANQFFQIQNNIADAITGGRPKTEVDALYRQLQTVSSGLPPDQVQSLLSAGLDPEQQRQKLVELTTAAAQTQLSGARVGGLGKLSTSPNSDDIADAASIFDPILKGKSRDQVISLLQQNALVSGHDATKGGITGGISDTLDKLNHVLQSTFGFSLASGGPKDLAKGPSVRDAVQAQFAGIVNASTDISAEDKQKIIEAFSHTSTAILLKVAQQIAKTPIVQSLDIGKLETDQISSLTGLADVQKRRNTASDAFDILQANRESALGLGTIYNKYVLSSQEAREKAAQRIGGLSQGTLLANEGISNQANAQASFIDVQQQVVESVRNAFLDVAKKQGITGDSASAIFGAKNLADLQNVYNDRFASSEPGDKDAQQLQKSIDQGNTQIAQAAVQIDLVKQQIALDKEVLIAEQRNKLLQGGTYNPRGISGIREQVAGLFGSTGAARGVRQLDLYGSLTKLGLPETDLSIGQEEGIRNQSVLQNISLLRRTGAAQDPAVASRINAALELLKPENSTANISQCVLTNNVDTGLLGNLVKNGQIALDTAVIKGPLDKISSYTEGANTYLAQLVALAEAEQNLDKEKSYREQIGSISEQIGQGNTSPLLKRQRDALQTLLDGLTTPSATKAAHPLARAGTAAAGGVSGAGLFVPALGLDPALSNANINTSSLNTSGSVTVSSEGSQLVVNVPQSVSQTSVSTSANRQFGTFSAGFQGGLGDIATQQDKAGVDVNDAASNFAAQGQQVADILNKSLSSAFGNFVTGSENASKAFRSFVLELLGDSARAFGDKGVQGILGLAFTALGGSGSTGGGGGTLNPSLPDPSTLTFNAVGGRIGFARGGNVPAMLTDGEVYIPPTAARNIGYSMLDKLNSGSLRKGFAGGGAVQVRGGSGTKDDIPANLPVGSYILRQSAVNKYGAGYLKALAGGRVQGRGLGGILGTLFTGLLGAFGGSASVDTTLDPVDADSIPDISDQADPFDTSFNQGPSALASFSGPDFGSVLGGADFSDPTAVSAGLSSSVGSNNASYGALLEKIGVPIASAGILGFARQLLAPSNHALSNSQILSLSQQAASEQQQEISSIPAGQFPYLTQGRNGSFNLNTYFGQAYANRDFTVPSAAGVPTANPGGITIPYGYPTPYVTDTPYGYAAGGRVPFAAGGLVGSNSSVPASPAGSSSSTNPNISINITNHGGSITSSTQTSNADPTSIFGNVNFANKMEKQVRQLVQSEMLLQLRPGGLSNINRRYIAS